MTSMSRAKSPSSGISKKQTAAWSESCAKIIGRTKTKNAAFEKPACERQAIEGGVEVPGVRDAVARERLIAGVLTHRRKRVAAGDECVNVPKNL